MCRVGAFSICGTNVRFFAGIPTGQAPRGTLAFDVGANNAPYVSNGVSWVSVGAGGISGGGVTTFEPNVLFFTGAPTGSAAPGTIAFDTTAPPFVAYVFNAGWQQWGVGAGGVTGLLGVCGPNIIFPPGSTPPAPPAGGGPGTPPAGTIALTAPGAGVPPGSSGIFVFFNGAWVPVMTQALAIDRLIYANFLTAEYFAQGADQTFVGSFANEPAIDPPPLIDGDGLLLELFTDPPPPATPTGSIPQTIGDMNANFYALAAVGFTIVMSLRPQAPGTNPYFFSLEDLAGHGIEIVFDDTAPHEILAGVFGVGAPAALTANANLVNNISQLCFQYKPGAPGQIALSVNGGAATTAPCPDELIGAVGNVLFTNFFNTGAPGGHIQYFAAYDDSVPLSKFPALSTVGAIPPLTIT